MNRIKNLQKLLCNESFIDTDGNRYDFRCFPNSVNLVINGLLIGDIEISEKEEKILISYNNGNYEVLESSESYLKLKQNNLIFTIEKIIKSRSI